jgi:hypothetical protein
MHAERASPAARSAVLASMAHGGSALAGMPGDAREAVLKSVVPVAASHMGAMWTRNPTETPAQATHGYQAASHMDDTWIHNPSLNPGLAAHGSAAGSHMGAMGEKVPSTSATYMPYGAASHMGSMGGKIPSTAGTYMPSHSMQTNHIPTYMAASHTGEVTPRMGNVGGMGYMKPHMGDHMTHRSSSSAQQGMRQARRPWTAVERLASHEEIKEAEALFPDGIPSDDGGVADALSRPTFNRATVAECNSTFGVVADPANPRCWYYCLGNVFGGNQANQYCCAWNACWHTPMFFFPLGYCTTCAPR